jgi:hypothetical protein
MSKAFERRIVAVERRLLPSKFVPRLIIVRGGLPDSGPTHATVGGHQMECRFHERVLSAATAAGEPFVVVGGLPTEPRYS